MSPRRRPRCSSARSGAAPRDNWAPPLESWCRAGQAATVDVCAPPPPLAACWWLRPHDKHSRPQVSSRPTSWRRRAPPCPAAAAVHAAAHVCQLASAASRPARPSRRRRPPLPQIAGARQAEGPLKLRGSATACIMRAAARPQLALAISSGDCWRARVDRSPAPALAPCPAAARVHLVASSPPVCAPFPASQLPDHTTPPFTNAPAAAAAWPHPLPGRPSLGTESRARRHSSGGRGFSQPNRCTAARGCTTV